MKFFAPDYYRQFRCIADKCRHSCCIGWEIDIDPDTREKYRHVPGEFGQRLNDAIEDGEVSSFRMLKVGQSPTSDSDCLQSPSVASTQPCAEGWPICPMLNQNGLCDLITELGEEHLCQICADHPRFRNHFADRTEIGLGLCCEEAARLILTWEEPVKLVILEDDGEQVNPGEDQRFEASLLGLRDILIGRIQDRTLPVLNRISWILEQWSPRMLERKAKEWVSLYRGLERLDPAWDAVLDSLLEGITMPPEELDAALEQFCVYMLYRHMPGAMEDGDHISRIKLAAYSTVMLFFICGAHTRQYGSCSLADVIEYARMYSAEIEYSEENIAALLACFAEEEEAS